MCNLRGAARLFSWWLGVVCLLACGAGYAQQATSTVTTPPGPEPSTRQSRAGEKYYAQGVRAMEKGDVDAAEKAFAKASKADPSDRDYALDWEIARQHLISKLIQDADKARLMGHPELARAKLAEALA